MGMFKVAVEEGVAQGAKKAKSKLWDDGEAAGIQRIEMVDQPGVSGMVGGGALGGLGGAAAGYGLASRLTENPKLLAAAAALGGLGGAGLGGYAGRRAGRAIGEGNLAVERAKVLDNPELARAEMAHPLNSTAVRALGGGLGGAAVGALMGGVGFGRPGVGALVGGALGAGTGGINSAYEKALVRDILARREVAFD